MAEYKIVEGKFFLNGALRGAGYTFTREQKYKAIPEGLVEVVEAPIAKKAENGDSKKGKAAPKAATKTDNAPDNRKEFGDIDFVKDPTVQL